MFYWSVGNNITTGDCPVNDVDVCVCGCDCGNCAKQLRDLSGSLIKVKYLRGSNA